MILQLFLGSIVIVMTVLIHGVMFFIAARNLPVLDTFLMRHLRHTGALCIMVCVVLWILLAHTLEVWLWAGALLLTDNAQTLEEATYFSVVSMTTLGYGDVILDRSWRLFGALMAPNGLILFGWSSAFFVWTLQRFVRHYFIQE